MKLTTKGRYAVTAMLDLALHQQGSTVSLADIALRQDISQSYLEQLFSKLRRKELVTSVRGPQGGYRLGREARAISVADIILVIDEPLDTTRCAGAANCQRGERCITHHLWDELNEVIVSFLRSVSLQQLAKQAEQPVLLNKEEG